ncbi:tyrosine-type recombinase/integrase [Streptomyces sp. NPDC050759]|uniref:tyrosine-type recombinase/integrase n=1 Tax=Streptomyces sp. NPDC050759 TaxID=3365635 RepID=UPI00379C8710
MTVNPDIASLLDSWLLHLAAERKSIQTRKTYGDGVRAFLRWCEAAGRSPTLDRPTVNAFVSALLDGGAEAATARSRQLAVRRFSAWLAEEGEIPADQLANLKPPRLDHKVVQELDDDQCRLLIKACSGRDFRDRRDEAIIRLMIETGARAGEIVAMETRDVDLKTGMAIIRRGKGGKSRKVPLSPQTCRAIDRYLRARRTHRLAALPDLWLGDRSKGFSYQALYSALKGRADAAGIPDFHPHVLRHTAAGRWLARGGSEGGLMAVAGWSRRDMIDRYTRATSERRAADEARRLNLGDL